ncbi:MAG: BamA/TamA family outer membrane protein [Bacteroidota bacterium]|nr:BamA/TamA family outer membrane protein [Bacteroidota bacterium]
MKLKSFALIFFIASLHAKPVFSQNKLTDTSAAFILRTININGNELTKDYIIHRELPFKAGDTINVNKWPDHIKLARQQLLNTALFTEVELQDDISGDSGTLTIKVRERWYIWPEPTFEFGPRDFTKAWYDGIFQRAILGMDVTHYNFRGRNEKLTVGFAAGWQKGFKLAYKAPYVNAKKTIGIQAAASFIQGRRLGYTVDSNLLRLTGIPKNWLFRQTNAGFAVIFRKKLKVNHTLGITYTSIIVDDTISGKLNPTYLGRAGADRWHGIRPSYKITYDNRDFYFYPTRGNFLSAEAVQNIPVQSAGSRSFLQLAINAKQYIPLTKRLVGALGLGWHAAIGDDIPLPLYPRFTSSRTVRGYERYYLAGAETWLGQGELRFKWLDIIYEIPRFPIKQFAKVPLTSYIKIYADAGTVKDPENIRLTLNNRLLRSVGIGADFYTYHDKIVRFEYSIPEHGRKIFFIHFISIL